MLTVWLLYVGESKALESRMSNRKVVMEIIEVIRTFGLFPTGIIMGMGGFILYQHTTFMRFLRKHDENIKELSVTLGNLNGFIQGKLT